jgi:hypothetical protein
VVFALVYLLLRRLVGWTATSSNEQLDTEVELVVLRHQLKVLRRQMGRPRLRRRDRLFMAAISRVLPRARWAAFVVSPQTLLRWHRELVRRKWTFRRRSAGGRAPIPGQVRDLILRMGRENPRWGASGSGASSPSVGIRVSATKIRTLLRASGIGPAARRGGPTWSTFLRSQAGAILALDFFNCGDGLASDALCAVRDPRRDASGDDPRGDKEPGLGVGHPSRPATWRWGSDFAASAT